MVELCLTKWYPPVSEASDSRDSKKCEKVSIDLRIDKGQSSGGHSEKEDLKCSELYDSLSRNLTTRYLALARTNKKNLPSVFPH
jgi:hypothetical protein